MVEDMKLSDSLTWYRLDRFNAKVVTCATGISEPSQRLLQSLKVVSPRQQDSRTSKRVFDANAVKRMACAKELSGCGISLPVAGKIICAATMIEDQLFTRIDPIVVMHAEGDIDPKTDLPPPRENPDPNGWFDPRKLVQTDDSDQ